EVVQCTAVDEISQKGIWIERQGSLACAFRLLHAAGPEALRGTGDMAHRLGVIRSQCFSRGLMRSIEARCVRIRPVEPRIKNMGHCQPRMRLRASVVLGDCG